MHCIVWLDSTACYTLWTNIHHWHYIGFSEISALIKFATSMQQCTQRTTTTTTTTTIGKGHKGNTMYQFKYFQWNSHISCVHCYNNILYIYYHELVTIFAHSTNTHTVNLGKLIAYVVYWGYFVVLHNTCRYVGLSDSSIQTGYYASN